MPAPIAKGIIVVASVLVAASIALYENPQVRVWVDSSRRKIALALHSLGDEINPQSRSRRNSEDENSLSEEQRRRRREEIIRRNRAELIRKASKEGVSVDLDELAAAGRDDYDEKRPVNRTRGSSFDDLVGSDGMLRGGHNVNSASAATTAVESAQDGLRQRIYGSQGLPSGSASANPFSDEAHVLFDQADAENQKVDPHIRTRESTATLQGDSSATGPPSASHYSAPPLVAPQLLVPINDQATEESFHSATGDFEVAQVEELRSNGTLTPTEGGFSTSVSVAGSNDDIGILSDILSQEASSEASFSDVGASTPGSWTDVDSDVGSDDFGHVSQQH